MLRQLSLIALAILSIAFPASSQTAFPKCSGTGAGSVYFLDPTFGQIYEMNPATGVSVPIPLAAPAGALGLAIGEPPTTGLPSPTFYTTFKIGLFTYLHYYNGAAWINTGRIMPYSNITGGGGYIYGYDCGSGLIYKASVTGTGNSTVLVAAGGSGTCGSCDIASDCAGNVYVINQGTNTLKKYASAGAATPGALLQTITITGTPVCGATGLAVNGNKVYYDGSDGNLYGGTIVGTSITFSALTTGGPFTTLPSDDFASCGFASIGNNVGTRDTIKVCGAQTNFVLRATGPGPYNWTVISGPAVITGTGATVTVNTPSTSVISHLDADCSGANTLVDTDVVYISKATVDAGPDHTITGCRGQFDDTLHASLSDTSIEVFNVIWSPLTPIVSGQTTLNPIIQPTATTTFVIDVSTITGCHFLDSVKVTIADSTPQANFQFQIKLGCEQDTVQFINTSSGLVDTSFYDFGDTTGTLWLQPGAIVPTRIVSAFSPQHIYPHQGIHSVLLYVANKYCFDTIRYNVNTLHTLKAQFKVDDDSGCSRQLVVFTNTTIVKAAPSFAWVFGDGSTSTLANPTHQYLKAGTYQVRLVVRDFLNCHDTAYHIIRIDSIPYVQIINPDSSICEGQQVTLNLNYLTVGNTGFTLNLGDGTVFQNANPVTYSYAEPGRYPVTLTAHYRLCPDTTITQFIDVRPFPGINIGPDTVLCPNGSPIVLTDRVNLGNPKAKYLWSTGETTSSILAKNIGNYWARVNVDGCTGTDSIMVNKDCYIDIPNSFTPNGDGNNDYFMPRQFMSRSLNTFKMTIFNRWGQVIYEASSINGRGWDGKFNDKDQPQGVYVYLIDVTFENSVKEHYTGNVTLLR